MTGDQLNALFEVCGAALVMLSVHEARQIKTIKGVSIWQLLFFQTWGVWNVIFYPMIDQNWSFYGGMSLTLANAVYLYHFWRYQ